MRRGEPFGNKKKAKTKQQQLVSLVQIATDSSSCVRLSNLRAKTPL